LNAGMLKGKVVPSDETEERKAVRASSLSPDGEIDVGSETKRYFEGLDMAVVVEYSREGSSELELIAIDTNRCEEGLARREKGPSSHRRPSPSYEKKE
jgi:hypothetical protein